MLRHRACVCLLSRICLCLRRCLRRRVHARSRHRIYARWRYCAWGSCCTSTLATRLCRAWRLFRPRHRRPFELQPRYRFLKQLQRLRTADVFDHRRDLVAHIVPVLTPVAGVGVYVLHRRVVVDQRLELDFLTLLVLDSPKAVHGLCTVHRDNIEFERAVGLFGLCAWTYERRCAVGLALAVQVATDHTFVFHALDVLYPFCAAVTETVLASSSLLASESSSESSSLKSSKPGATTASDVCLLFTTLLCPGPCPRPLPLPNGCAGGGTWYVGTQACPNVLI
jgi:hypothetical protein